MLHDYEYVKKSDSNIKSIYKNLISMINEVQNIVRHHFTFSFQPVGSYSRDMITHDKKSNVGFDFDFNIEVNDDGEEYSPKEIKNILMNAFGNVIRKYGYSRIEDSTRVITIKKTNSFLSSVEHSCDFAIVNNYYENGCSEQEYIHFNKKRNEYYWCKQAKGYRLLPEKIEWLKKNNLWKELEDYYVHKKNTNNDDNIHSRTIFAISVQELCQKNGYYN